MQPIPFYPLLKRFLDVVVSLAGLLCLWPLFLFIAVAVKLDSPGPILYSQERLTLNRKPFRVHKFRSMVVGARARHLRGEVPREQLITRVGRFLRYTHFDEFPQLFNVLAGDLSLVGPRPLMAKWLNEKTPDPGFADSRFTVKAGMAGLERLYSLLPGARKQFLRLFPRFAVVPGKEAWQLDGYYAKHQSLFFDAKIFFLTFFMTLYRVLELVFRRV